MVRPRRGTGDTVRRRANFYAARWTAGLTGWLRQAGFPSLAVVLLAAAGALIVAGYASASRHDVDATTEVSAIDHRPWPKL